jgi:hypothetical protein
MWCACPFRAQQNRRSIPRQGGSIRDHGDRAVFYSMIRKSGYRFSEKIVLKQEAKSEMVVQLEIIPL